MNPSPLSPFLSPLLPLTLIVYVYVYACLTNSAVLGAILVVASVSSTN